MAKKTRQSSILSIEECFLSISDPRIERAKKHLLIDILTISLCAVLCGAETISHIEQFGKDKQDWFKRLLKLPNGIPSHDTIGRVLALISPEKFQECFLQWTQGIRELVDGDIIAIDGKTLRGSRDENNHAVHMVSAWSKANGIVLGALRVEDKSNEITAIPKLLENLELSGCIVTIDAMGTQSKIAQKIVERGGDYVLALKDNQRTTRHEVESFLDQAIQDQRDPSLKNNRDHKPVELSSYQTIEKDHGRIETRTYSITEDIDWYADKDKWKGLRSVGVVEAKREIKDKVSVERRYYLCSIQPDAKIFAKAVRGHWAIENNLHWSLDVTFKEDLCRVRMGNAAENFSTLKRMALNILKKDTKVKGGLKMKQMSAGWNLNYLKHLLNKPF